MNRLKLSKFVFRSVCWVVTFGLVHAPPCFDELHAQTSTDPCSISQLFDLQPVDPDPIDEFGSSLAVNENFVAIGCQWSSEDDLVHSGSVYVYDRTSGAQLFKLRPNDPNAHHQFGTSVAIQEHRILIGGNGTNGSGNDDGSAYLFDLQTGVQIRKFIPQGASINANFGSSVALNSTTAFIGDSNDEFIYYFDIETGDQLGRLEPTGAAPLSSFGQALDLDGNYLIVGAPLDGPNFSWAGAAYLFDITTYQQVAQLIANDTGNDDRFGTSVAIFGNHAVVGAPFDDNENGSNAGSVYLYDVTQGQQTARIVPNVGAAGDLFGNSVAVNGNRFVVGASANDDVSNNAGTSYLFDLSSRAQLAQLVPSNSSSDDRFGSAAAMDESTVVIAAGTFNEVGNAYLFEIDQCPLVLTSATFSLVRGIQISGDLQATYNSDDSDLHLQPGITLSADEPPIGVEFVRPLDLIPESQLSIIVEAAANTIGIGQTIEMFNHTSGQFEIVDSRNAMFNSDLELVLDLSTSLDDYVGTDGVLAARVSWKTVGPILIYPWTVGIDKVGWIAD